MRDLHIPHGQSRELLLELWERQALMAGTPEDIPRQLRKRFEQDIAIRAEATIQTFLEQAGFERIIKPFSSLIYGSWTAQKKA